MFCCLDNKVFLSHLKSKTPILSIEIKKNIRILQTTHTPKGPDKKCKGKKIEPSSANGHAHPLRTFIKDKTNIQSCYTVYFIPKLKVGLELIGIVLNEKLKNKIK